MSEATIALVTGANKGIGYEIAAGLGALGWKVAVGARDAGPVPWCPRCGEPTDPAIAPAARRGRKEVTPGAVLATTTLPEGVAHVRQLVGPPGSVIP